MRKQNDIKKSYIDLLGRKSMINIKQNQDINYILKPDWVTT